MSPDDNSPTHQFSNSPTARESDSLLVGRIARAQGNRGEVIVNLDTDFPVERFTVGRVLRIEREHGTEARRIVSARMHQGRPVIALDGISTMTDAEGLAGAELRIAESEIGPLPAGTFYHHDLVGCEVRDVSGRRIGTVSGVLGPMERSLLAVDTASGEVLIPLVTEICVTVDPPAKTIVVNPPEGLLEANRTD